MLASLSSKQRAECLQCANKYRKSGAPKASATCFRLGHVAKGRGNTKYKIIKQGRSRRWSKIQRKQK